MFFLFHAILLCFNHLGKWLFLNTTNIVLKKILSILEGYLNITQKLFCSIVSVSVKRMKQRSKHQSHYQELGIILAGFERFLFQTTSNLAKKNRDFIL
jgi:hypothetical protein